MCDQTNVKNFLIKQFYNLNNNSKNVKYEKKSF